MASSGNFQCRPTFFAGFIPVKITFNFPYREIILDGAPLEEGSVGCANGERGVYSRKERGTPGKKGDAIGVGGRMRNPVASYLRPTGLR